MKNLLACLFAGAALTACASPEPTAPPSSPSPPPPPSAECRQDGLDRFVGETRSPALEERIRAASGARVFRWLEPDTIVTMEYRFDRVSASLDAQNRVTRVGCG